MDEEHVRTWKQLVAYARQDPARMNRLRFIVLMVLAVGFFTVLYYVLAIVAAVEALH